MPGKTTLLIIDDDVNVCTSLKRNLELRYPYAVLHAHNGREGIALAREKKPDVILLDVMMPGMTGGEVAETLREGPRTKDIPIIFLTGMLNRQELAERGGEVGGETFLAKPVDIQEIVTAVREALAQKG